MVFLVPAPAARKYSCCVRTNVVTHMMMVSGGVASRAIRHEELLLPTQSWDWGKEMDFMVKMRARQGEMWGNCWQMLFYGGPFNLPYLSPSFRIEEIFQSGEI